MWGWALWVWMASAGVSSLWLSPDACDASLKNGGQEQKASQTIRVGTWNVRWFPDGTPGREPQKNNHRTDVGHMACALAGMRWDVVLLQEIKGTARAQEALQELQKKLLQYTGVRWKVEMPLCQDDTRQHVALLYRTDAVKVRDVVLDPVLDPTAAERGMPGLCPGFLRPALGAYVESTRKKGVDFHVVAVHLDSGRDLKDYQHRVYAWKALEEVLSKRMRRIADKDYVVAGDWNAMGADKGPDATPQKELVSLNREVGMWKEQGKLLPSDKPCSHYYKKHASLMDVFVVSAAMAEYPSGGQKVSGVCGVLGCADKKAEEAYAFQHISDHCPVYVDFLDRDEDSLRGVMR